MSMRIAVLTKRGISINVSDGTAGIASSNVITIPYDRFNANRTLKGISNIYYKITSEEAIKYMLNLKRNGIKAEPYIEFSKRWFAGVCERIDITSAVVEDIDEAYLRKLRLESNNDEYYSFLKCQIDRVANMKHTLMVTGHTIQKHKVSEYAEMLDTFYIGITKHGYEMRVVIYCKDSRQVSIDDAKRIADEACKRGLAFTSLTNTMIKDKAYILVGFVHNNKKEKRVAANSIKESITEVLKDRIDIVETADSAV